jgi:hypothetical protein
MHPWTLILIGLLLSLLGTALPFLIVIHLLPSTYFLNFFSFLSMIIGLSLGIAGGTQYVQRRRK